MAVANPNYGQVFTTAIESRTKMLADNLTNNNAFLSELNKRGNIKTVSGGHKILQEIDYQENPNFQSYSGFDFLQVGGTQDLFSSASYEWKQAAISITMSGLETLQNSGKERMIELMGAKIKNAERTFQNKMAEFVYSDGTGNGGKDVAGLQLYVADDPTIGTVGGIDRATFDFWRNQKYDVAVEGGTTATSVSNIYARMSQLYNSLCRGADKPNLILADSNHYQLYETALQAQQRFTNEDKAVGGFQSLAFKGNVPVVLDGGIGGACPTDHMYFLNMDFLHWRPHKDRNMVVLDGDRVAVNQDAMTRIIGWAGNMTLSGAKFHGVLFGATSV